MTLHLLRIGRGLQAIRRIGSHVPITVQPPCFYLRNNGSKHSTGRKPGRFYLPDSSISLRQSQCRNAKFSFPPLRVCKMIRPASRSVTCLTISHRIQHHRVISRYRKSETDVFTISLIIGSKHRTVTCFQAKSRRATIKCAGITILTVHTNKIVPFGTILQATGSPTLMIIIRS